MTSFRPYDPDQQLLLPPSLRDWLPPDHLVWFISETVDQLGLSEIIEGYRDGGQGNLPYHPAMMLKILIFAYATGVFSSRRIARQIEENIAFRVLAAGNTPDHRTICRFREPKDQENFTDPESRIMKEGSGAFQQCYNAQAAVDGQQRIIVAVSVQQSASDARALIPMVELSGEFNLVCLALNLRRMSSMIRWA